MHYTIYALENTKAQLCVDKATTSIEAVKNIIVNTYMAMGYIVNVEVEA